MNNPSKTILLGIIASALALGSGTSSNAQILNYQASTYNGGTTWTDSASGVVATATGTPTLVNAGDGFNINTTNGAFTFNADSVPGLVGLTSYTIAVGFTTGSTAGGIYGADIPATGAGDQVLAYDGGTGGQLQTIAGNSAGGDNSMYAVQNGNFNYQFNHTDLGFTTGSPTGLVLVVNSGSAQLYVNGNLNDAQTFTVAPFGYSAGGSPTSSYSFGIGISPNNAAIYSNATLDGDITQFQIYNTALSSGSAADLSLNIGADSLAIAAAPEPSTYAMMFLGLGVLLFVARRRTVA